MDITKKNESLTNNNKLEFCKKLKDNMPKSFIMQQLRIDRSTLNDISKSEENLKKSKEKKEELSFDLNFALNNIQQLIYSQKISAKVLNIYAFFKRRYKASII